MFNAYFGDFSSIGYDALSFKLPMGFLLPTNKKINDSALFKCGATLSHSTSLGISHFENIFKKTKFFIPTQNELYEYNFSHNENWKEDLLQACE